MKDQVKDQGDHHPKHPFALMAKMAYNREQRVRLKADFLRLILACRVDPARQSVLVEFVETYLPLAGREQAEFQQIVVGDKEYAEVEQMITVYEKKGIEKGKQGDLILLLEKKFGKLSAALRRKVCQIESPEKLNRCY